MTATTSRRAVLAGAATLPVLAIPALAADHADAELIALGKTHDALVLAFEDAVRRSKPTWDAERRALAALLKRPHTEEEIISALEQVNREYPIAFPHPDDVSDAMAAPEQWIMALPATTIAGLAVKARLAKLSAPELWDEPEDDQDLDKLKVRKLIDSIPENVEPA